MSPKAFPSPARVGVAADDLTGAGDAALPFFRAGRKVEITIWDEAGPRRGASRRGGAPAARELRPSPGTQVWVIDTESRHLPPAAARRRARGAAAALRRWGASFFYKKIDSTLRGPFAAELAGFFEGAGPFSPGKPAAGGPPAALVPAFPRLGRTTRGGIHFVDGVPLHRTAFGRDPREPLRSSSVAGRLGGAARGFWVPDVSSQADLARAARRILRGDGISSRAAAASAGLAEELVRLWYGRGVLSLLSARRSGNKITSRAPQKFKAGRRPGGAKVPPAVLVVVGSAHPRSRRQARELRRSLAGRIVDLSRAPQRASPAKADVFLLEAPRARGSAERVAKDLARRAAAWARKLEVRRVAATGGETAYRLSRLWGRRWRVVGAVERGVALCASVPPGRWMALKPGGFGRDNTLARCAECLQRT